MLVAHAGTSLLMTIAGLALVAAMWFAVRRPPVSPGSRKRGAWQVEQAVMSAVSATLSALCVLIAVGQLQ